MSELYEATGGIREALGSIEKVLSAILHEQRLKNQMLQITIDLQRESNARYMAQTNAIKHFTEELKAAEALMEPEDRSQKQSGRG